MKPLLHQRAIKIVMYILGGFLALGAVLGSVANATKLLTPLVASIGTACIVLVWLLAYIILPSHPLPWGFGNQRMRVKNQVSSQRLSLLVWCSCCGCRPL